MEYCIVSAVLANKNSIVPTKQQVALLHAEHKISCEILANAHFVQSSTEFTSKTSLCSRRKAAD